MDEKELMLDFIKQQKNCEFSLRFFLQKEGDLWKNVCSMLKLVKKGTRNEVKYDYGEYVLGEKLLTIRKGLNILSSLYREDIPKGKLIIPDYGEFRIQSRNRIDFVGSNQRYGLLKFERPMRFWSFRVIQDRVAQDWNRELLKEEIPYYPNVMEAVIDFFEIANDYFNSYGEVYVVALDYRAKIESLRLILSKVDLKISSPEIELNDLVIKAFAKFGARTTTLGDMYPKSEKVEFDIGFQPDTLSVVLLSRKDQMKIDTKGFTKWRIEGEGVVIERPEEEILSLTKVGESQNLEYKPDILDENKRNDFIETIVAFLNTNRGTILIGLDDKGNIIGSKKTADDIQKMIHDCCEPPPKDIRIEDRMIASDKILIVEVPEGDDKPYQSKIDKNWYVRHNANDMKMERSELLSILAKQKEHTVGY
jgi:hypothetical protein